MDEEDEHLVSSIEDDPIAQQLPKRATFIPFRHKELQTRIETTYSIQGADKSKFQQLCKRLQAIFHIEHLSALMQLEDIYSPLDPDEEMVELDELTDQERDDLTERLFDRLSGLLFSAHYKRLTRAELERAIEIGSQWGVKLDVDFNLYNRMEIFARGYRVIRVTRYRWQNFFRPEQIELPEFQRLIMAFRLNSILDEKPVRQVSLVSQMGYTFCELLVCALVFAMTMANGWVWVAGMTLVFLRIVTGYLSVRNRNKNISGWNNLPQAVKKTGEIRKHFASLIKGDEAGSIETDRVYLKTFKNIPETDLEILLPGTKIKFSLLDHGKILLPTAMALYKLSRFIVAITVLWVAAFTIDEIIGSMILFGAILGYVAKSILSYFRTKTKYQFGLTRSLYLKNLGNNSGVIYRILNEAEEQELLEAVLGYSILWQQEEGHRQRNEPFKGMTELELDQAVEKFLFDETELDIDFEIHDALGKLARLGLANVSRNGRWSSVPIVSATERLSESWDRLFQQRNLRAISGETVDEDLFTS